MNEPRVRWAGRQDVRSGSRGPLWIFIITAVGGLALGCTGDVTGSAANGGNGGSSRSGGGSGAGSNRGGAGGGSSGSGQGGSSANGTGTNAQCTARDLLPVQAPLRRLTASQYNNALQDLLQDTSFPAQTVPAEAAAEGFLNNAENQAPTDELVTDYQNAAVQAGAAVLAKRAKLVPCTTSDSACGGKFIAAFGQRAFRRPLTSDETTRFNAFFSTQLTATNFNVALQLVAQAILVSPQFLYVPEFGSGAKGGTNPLTPYELATRMALLLTDSIPDDALLAAAAQNQLATPAQIDAQVQRLLKTPRARAAVASFHQQWLQTSRLEQIASVQKNPTVFPQWNESLKTSMRTELANFVGSVMFDGDGKLSSLFTSNTTWVDDNLAPIYGVKAPQGGGMVALDASKRSGVLTQPAYLAGHSHQTQTSIVWRGQGVLSQLLCAPPPAPPKNVDTKVMDTPGLTTTGRERETSHLTEPSCAACHTSMDNIGFAFEHFDALGGYRTSDGGKAIDSSGEIKGTDFDGSVKDVIELSSKLASSAQVQSCVTKQWFRYAFARLDAPEDSCTLSSLNDAFKSADASVPALLSALVKSQAFQSLPAAQ